MGPTPQPPRLLDLLPNFKLLPTSLGPQASHQLNPALSDAVLKLFVIALANNKSCRSDVISCITALRCEENCCWNKSHSAFHQQHIHYYVWRFETVSKYKILFWAKNNYWYARKRLSKFDENALKCKWYVNNWLEKFNRHSTSSVEWVLWVWAHCACWCSTRQCTSVCLW